MKVLVLNPDRTNNPVGGLGTSFREVYARLKDDVEFYVVGYPDPKTEIKNYRSVETLMNLKHGGVAGLLAHTFYISEALRFKITPDIIHAYDWTVYFAAVELASNYNVPLVVTMQTSPKALMEHQVYFCHNRDSVDGHYIQDAHLQLEQLGLRNAHHIISASHAYKKMYPEYAHKTTVIPLGIELSDWKPVEEVKLPGDRKYKAVYLGRVSTVKGVHAILNVDLPPEFDLLFIGGEVGGDERGIQDLQMAKEASNYGFHFRDRVYGQEKIDIMCAADIILVPSLHEPFGAIGLEALASKSIVISSRIDGLGDYLNEDNSIFCEVSPHGIKQALNQYLTMSNEDKEKLIENGVTTCKSYSWGRTAKLHLNVYEDALYDEPNIMFTDPKSEEQLINEYNETHDCSQMNVEMLSAEELVKRYGDELTPEQKELIKHKWSKD